MRPHSAAPAVRWPLVVVSLLALMVAGCQASPAPHAAPPGSSHRPSAVVPTEPGPSHRPSAVTGERPRQPNILLITTDDQDTFELDSMPRTRRLLAGEGMTFTQALSPHPLCCPARAGILTGQYAQNNGVRHNHGRYGGFKALKVRRNLGSWLQAAGYDTALVGKFLNEYGPRDPRQPGWTVWNPMVRGVYSYYGTRFYNDGDPKTYDGYSVNVVGDRTVDYIHAFAARDRPFFIWASQVAPHAIALARGAWGAPLAPPGDDGAGVPAPALRKPSFRVTGPPQPGLVGQRGPWSRSYIQHYTDRRAASLRAVDDAVAAAVRALADTGQLDNTYIFFTTDNADLLGEHGYIGKNVLYEENLRIPLLVRGPGVPAGSRSDLPVTLFDLAPTFLQIAGGTAGVVEDGESFLPALRGQSMPWRDTQLVQAGSTRRRGPSPGWYFRGVRTARYSYSREPATGRETLYDRVRDPYELRNVAQLPQYASVRRELARRTTLLARCAGPSCNRRFGDVGAPTGQ